MAHATSVNDTFCLGHWNKENEKKNKHPILSVDNFSLIFVYLSLAWIL